MAQGDQTTGSLNFSLADQGEPKDDSKKKSTPTPAPTSTPGEGSIGSPGGISGGGKTAPPTTTFQGDINAYMKPYIDQLSQLGPEYAQELSYLQPYISGTGVGSGSALEQSVAKEYGGSGVDAPNPNTPQAQALDTAAANVAKTNDPTPGFGKIADAAKAFEGTVPYSDVIGAVEGAQKNELLYGSVPNFSAVNTQGWGPSMQALYSYLQQTAGGGSSLGVNPLTAATQLTTQQNQQNPNTYNPGTQPGPSSGGTTTNIQ